MLTRLMHGIRTGAMPWLPESGAMPDDHPLVQTVRKKAEGLLYRMTCVEENPLELRWDHFVRAWLRLADQPAPENVYQMARAFSGGELSEAIGAAANSVFLSGYEAQPDSTEGWVAEVPARDFKPFDVFGLKTGARLRPIPRGGTARHAAVGVKAEAVKITRFGRVYTIDEQDLLDSGDSVAAWLRPLEELGRAARRVKGDLVYSLILENPTLAADNLALFEAGTHGNLGTAALGTAGLGAAVAAIAGQTLTDERGQRIHLNLRPKALVVPPALWETARETEAKLWIGDGAELAIRTESRLGPAGLADPVTNHVRTGSDTNWLLVAGPGDAPSVVVSYLNGQSNPRIRRAELNRGQWGIGWDIAHDVAAAAVDYRGVYWSSGTG